MNLQTLREIVYLPVMDDRNCCSKPFYLTFEKQRRRSRSFQQNQSQQGHQLAVLRSCLRRLIDGTIQAAIAAPGSRVPGRLDMPCFRGNSMQNIMISL